MKAKDLAKILLEKPDTEVRVWFGDGYRYLIQDAQWHPNYSEQILLVAEKPHQNCSPLSVCRVVNPKPIPVSDTL